MRAARLLPALLVTAAVSCAPHDTTPEVWHAVPVSDRPHDPTAFTEGLVMVGDRLYESTGLVGRSWVRWTDYATGVEGARAELPAEWFGEGIAVTPTAVTPTAVTPSAVTPSALWQLTWRDRVAIERDPATLAERRRISYIGEGWGICARGDRLVMSDGSTTLTFRDPATFARVGSVTVTARPGTQLNELECAADGSIYANVFPTDEIVRIDPDTGAVLARIDAGALRAAAGMPAEIGNAVLNGIAEVPGTDRFLLTGKFWPRLFEVRFER